MKLYIYAVCCSVILFSGSLLFAQDQDNESNSESYQRELTRIVSKEHKLTEMPIGYAADFPLYSNDVVYIQFGSYPRMIHGKTYDPSEPDMQKRRNFRVVKAVVFSHIIPVGENEDVNKQSKKARDWYKLNAKNAGYQEVESVESDFGEYSSMKYVKEDDFLSKTVDVEIKRGRIFLVVFADEEVEPVPIPVFEGEVPVPAQQR